MSSLSKAIELRRASIPAPFHLSYHISGASSCLRVLLDDGTHWGFPWKHFLYAQHSFHEAQEILILTFVSHEVTLQGWSFELLVEAVANSSLDKISALPCGYRDPEDSKPFIYKISVQQSNDEFLAQDQCAASY